MARPRFSVVVPTKNRPELLARAIESVRSQSFEDFELVVSDNWNDERTSAVLNRVSDPRLRSIRPDREMNMPDHWEFASRHVSGAYLLFLTDRMVMRPSALALIDQQLRRASDPDLCSWWIQAFSDESGQLQPTPLTEKIDTVPCATILGDFVFNRQTLWRQLPRGLNSCVRIEYLTDVRRRFGQVYSAVSPDFASAFLLLSQTSHVLRIDRALYVAGGETDSNGRRTQAGKSSYMASLGQAVDPSSHVPVKTFTVWNSVYNDYELVRARVGESYRGPPLDLPSYFAAVLEEIEYMRRIDVQRDMTALAAEWDRARREHRLSLDEINRARSVPYTWRQRLIDLVKRTPVGILARPVRALLATLRSNRGRHRDALRAAQETDDAVRFVAVSGEP